MFEDAQVRNGIQRLYEDGRQVSVILGGPPCQGFSRVGRGKIRSLREQSVHVHVDESAVDSRNLLLEQYVLFVSALAPQMFLFENVRHFQAVVRTAEREFDAADVLAEAIEKVSSRGLGYDVSSRVVVASEHLVPQARERYFMVGVRQDVTSTLPGLDVPRWCLSLPRRPEIPLESAFDGLPDPIPARDTEQSSNGMVPVNMTGTPSADPSNSNSIYLAWVSPVAKAVTGTHIARVPRADDRALFELLGPGKRWMDYRCDDAPTLERLSALLGALRRKLARSRSLVEQLGVNLKEIEELEQLTDGSLSLRLLLERIPALPGEVQHHLLTVAYLKKKEGQHGDWLARMDPSKPSKTMMSHMAKDTYAYVHPTRPRTLSVREAARIQTFPDDFKLGSVGLVDGFRIVGNAVPPLLSTQLADRVAQILVAAEIARADKQVSEHSSQAERAQPFNPVPLAQ